MNLKYEKSKKNILILRLLTFILIIILVAFYFMYQNYLKREYGNSAPKIELIGESQIRISENYEYEERGVIATDARGHDISKKVKIRGAVNSSEEGPYFLYYSVSDRYGNQSREILRRVIVGESVQSHKQNGKINHADLLEIVQVEVNKHLKELDKLADTDESTCAKVDYLIPYIQQHYSEDEIPKRNVLRSAIREVLGEEKNE